MTPLYFDYASSSPCFSESVSEMLPYFNQLHGNPSNAFSQITKNINNRIELSRRIIAKEIHCLQQEIIYISSATEANNIILYGAIKYYMNSPRDEIVTSSIEHKSILNPLCYFAKDRTVKIITPKNGLNIEINDLVNQININTKIVSLILTNNETGVISDLKNICKYLRNRNPDIFIHCDASQYFGRHKMNVKEIGLDAMTFSSHKIYGPKGIAGLYIKRNKIESLKRLIHGGGHELGIRSGTLNVPAIIGFSKSIEIFSSNREKYNQHISAMQQYFETRILKIVNATINGEKLIRTNHITSITLNNNKKSITELKEIIPSLVVSTGAACNTFDLSPSHVLRAIGYSNRDIKNTIRISYGLDTTTTQIDELLNGISMLY